MNWRKNKETPFNLCFSFGFCNIFRISISIIAYLEFFCNTFLRNFGALGKITLWNKICAKR